MSRWWPLGAFAAAALVALAWVPNAYFFMLEAWGERGEPKSALFELWAAATWIGWPVAVWCLVLAGLIGTLVAAGRAQG
ncbi:MAG: hypothetical protein KC619_34580 [Myxococcales bacterium]|nr:hypothetical protein [Myxococcales bacterium]